MSKKPLLLVTVMILASPLANANVADTNPSEERASFHSIQEILDVIPKELRLASAGRPNEAAMELAKNAIYAKAVSHVATIRLRADEIHKWDKGVYEKGFVITQHDPNRKRDGLQWNLQVAAFFPESAAANLNGIKLGSEVTITGVIANAGCLMWGKGGNQLRTWIDLSQSSVGSELHSKEPPTELERGRIAPPKEPISELAATVYKPDQSPIEILKEQGPNLSAWVSSTLDTPIPEAIWENMTFLKEALRDEAAQKPRASTVAYGAALRLCAIILDDLGERKVTVTKAGGGDVLHQGSQLTESRRDHLTWPMYALERDERGDRHAWAKQHQKELVDWAKRTNDMRYDLGVWYDKFREALRQSPQPK